MSTSIKIDGDIELPARPRRGGQRLYPLDELNVGQSFFVPAEDNTDEAVIRLQGTLHSCARGVAKRTGARFTTRQWEQGARRGIRVWRVEAPAGGQDGGE